MDIELQNKEPQNFERVKFIIRYSLFDILLFKIVNGQLTIMNCQ
jgi:hypothetical protein